MADRPVDRDIARHYAWGNGCDGWHLLDQPDLSVIEECVPARAGETAHRHARARQFFYVLSGQAMIEIEGTALSLGPGQGVGVAPGSAHRLANPGESELRLLVISAPHSHGDREELLSAC